jgi:hypothetical protein
LGEEVVRTIDFSDVSTPADSSSAMSTDAPAVSAVTSDAVPSTDAAPAGASTDVPAATSVRHLGLPPPFP